jgi:hypothetical protein
VPTHREALNLLVEGLLGGGAVSGPEGTCVELLQEVACEYSL